MILINKEQRAACTTNNSTMVNIAAGCINPLSNFIIRESLTLKVRYKLKHKKRTNTSMQCMLSSIVLKSYIFLSDDTTTNSCVQTYFVQTDLPLTHWLNKNPK